MKKRRHDQVMQQMRDLMHSAKQLRDSLEEEKYTGPSSKIDDQVYVAHRFLCNAVGNLWNAERALKNATIELGAKA